VEKLNAEHTYIRIGPGNASPPRVGDKVEIYVPYVDGTFNLYDRIYAVRKDKVEKVWEISGRCKSA
jgi:D-serine deaminase-like pyridoxal phosphate-dependent protein